MEVDIYEEHLKVAWIKDKLLMWKMQLKNINVYLFVLKIWFRFEVRNVNLPVCEMAAVT